MFGGWNHQDSPFHEGERQVQEQLGVRDKIETFARRVVRDHMPDQHRDFYAELPFVLMGSVDVIHGKVAAGTPPINRSHQIDDRTRSLIEGADTLFIATA